MAHATISEVVTAYLPYLCDVMDTLIENEGWQGAGRHRHKLRAVLFDIARASWKLGRDYARTDGPLKGKGGGK